MQSDYAKKSLEELLCLYALGKIGEHQLSDISEVLIDKGVESPYLIELLISNGLTSDEIRELFNKAMYDAGVNIPNQKDAAMRLSTYIAEKIVSGEITAYEGAYKIWKDILDYIDPIPNELWAFKSNASAIEDEYSFNQDYEGGKNTPGHTQLIESCIREIRIAAESLCKYGKAH